MRNVHKYNLEKNAFIDDLPKTNEYFGDSPKLWQNENDGTIHIFGIYSRTSPNRIMHEWIDPRQDNNKWNKNTNINHVIQKVVPQSEISHFRFINSVS